MSGILGCSNLAAWDLLGFGRVVESVTDMGWVLELGSRVS
jgi:hypothetical protein